VEDLKNSANLTGESYPDRDIERALTAASNVVDEITGRTFGPAAASTQTFTPVSEMYLYVGNVSAITNVTVQGTIWVAGTDYYLDGGDTIRVIGVRRLPRIPGSVSITATYGYSAVPPEISEATQLIAAQLVKRKREAPFGVLASTFTGEAIRIGRFDPHIDSLLSRYKQWASIE
jgi:hypothetical protein